MKYILIILVLLGAMSIGCGKTSNAKDHSENEIRKMLVDLKNSPVAICKYDGPHDSNFAPPSYDFVCPIDGKATTYYGRDVHKLQEVSYMPNMIENLNSLATDKGITFEVDITPFCKKHFPDLENRSAILIVAYKNGRVVKTPIESKDISVLSFFLSGMECFLCPSPAMCSYSTKSELPRLAEIFGQDINSL